MARIKIKDLPKDAKVSKEEMKRIKGGAQVDLFVKFEPAPQGEATDKDHKEWIEIESSLTPTR